MKRENGRRLSLISDIFILIAIILLASPFLKNIDLSAFNGGANYQEVLSLSSSDIMQKSVAEQNELFVQKIKQDYGIDIKYGKEVHDIVSKVSATDQENINIINNNIINIEKALEKYPKEMFNIFKAKNKKYSLSIILVSKFSNNNLALASKNNFGDFKIYVSNTEKFERAYHHEMFHVLEYYIGDNNSNRDLFASWDSLNPRGFNYSPDVSVLTKDYVFNEILKSSDTYFVTKYAKTSEKEDRAETFAELMTISSRPKYLNSGENIRKKADLISQVIGKNIPGAKNSSTLYWNRFFK